MKAIVLAAGKGTRLKTDQPKALIQVLGKALIEYVIGSIYGAGLRETVVVIGHKGEEVKKFIEKHKPKGLDVTYVKQKKLDGTGGAVKAAIGSQRSASGRSSKYLVVINADTPLISSSSISRLIDYAKNLDLQGCCLSGLIDDPHGYGRILRDQNNKFIKIIEETELGDSPECFREINAGAYVFKYDGVKKYLDMLEGKKNGEYYLTEIFKFMSIDGKKIEAVQLKDLNEAFGINSREDLVKINSYLKIRVLDQHIKSGVYITDPASTYIESDVQIGQDTIIHPFTVIRKGTKIGSQCEIGPFAHIRGGSIVEDESIIGNFVEVNRSVIGKHGKAKHLAYLGDATIGSNVNIGAGTITANYDGTNKHKTIVESGASTGSNTVLVAPVVMESGSKTGAGAVVTKNTRIRSREVYTGVPAKPLVKARR